METRTGSLFPRLRTARSAFFAIAIAIAVAAGLTFGTRIEARPASPSTSGMGATVYVIRGGGGYFPNLGNIVYQHYESRGLVVVDYRVHQRELAVHEIVTAHRAGKLPHGVFLVGYSLGGTGSIRIAEALEEARVPVRLLVLIETVSPHLLVPANVGSCFNLFHAPSSVVGPVSAASPKTKIANCEAHGDAGFGKEYSHFAIPWVDGVHELVAGEIVNSVQKKPLGQVVQNRFRVSTAKAAVGPAEMTASSVRKTPGTQPKARTESTLKPAPVPAPSRTIIPFSTGPWTRKPPRGQTQFQDGQVKLQGW